MKYISTIIILIVLTTNLLAQNLSSSDALKIKNLKAELEKSKSEEKTSQLAQIYNKIAHIYWDNNSYNNAVEYFEESLKINKELGNKNAEAKINSYLGSIHFDMANYKKAVKYFQTALKICKRKKNKYEMAVSYLHIAQTQKELKQYDRAIKNLSKSEEIAKEFTNFKLLKSIAFTFVEIYKIKGNTQKEAKYFEKYATYDKYIQSENAESKLEENNKMMNYALNQKNETEKALFLSEEERKTQNSLIELKSDSLQLAKEKAEEQRLQIELDKSEIERKDAELEKDRILKLFLLSIFIGVALLASVLFFTNKQKQKANKLLFVKNKKIKNQTKILENKNIELRKLSIVAAKTDNAILIMDPKGNFEWINESFTRIFGQTFDELVNATPNIISPNTSPKIVQLINKCINDKETVYYNLSILTAKKEETTVHVTLTPILNEKNEIEKIVAIDSDITKIRKANQEIERQHKILEAQNEHITSSIKYAKTIQAASLPNPPDFDKNYDSFLIYKPKDIVSGDFYWFTNLSTNEKEYDKFIISVIDSTGHGVPGAFMSLIGTQILNEIVISNKNYNPAQIIEKLDRKIIVSLNQQTTDNNDGMDLGIALVEKKENGKYSITYAGAKRPLYIFRKNENDLEIFRGSRRSVGGIKKTITEVEFKNFTTELSKGDCIYLTSDGLVDQPNSKRVRYGSTQLTAILKIIGNENMNNQKEKILNSYTAHTGETPQRDDITLLGIQLG